MIFSDLKHMCPKAEAVDAKYSTLLWGSSYLWNHNCKIDKCHRTGSLIKLEETMYWLRGPGRRWVLGLKQDWNWFPDLSGKVTWICFCKAQSGWVPPQFKCWNLISNMMVFEWGVTFGGWLGHKSRGFINVISALTEGTPETSLAPCACEDSEKMTIYEVGRRFLLDTKFFDTLIWDFPVFVTVKNTHLCL